MKAGARILSYLLAALGATALTPVRQAVVKQNLTIDRDTANYATCDQWTTSTVDHTKQVGFVLDPSNFEDMVDESYVEVEGYLVYVAHSGNTVTIEDDGDYHFCISDAQDVHHTTPGARARSFPSVP